MAGRVLKLASLTAVVVGIVRTLKQRTAQTVWHSTPVPVPAAPSAEPPQDQAGASPDEAIADQVEEPHLPTTPDEPVDVVQINDDTPR